MAMEAILDILTREIIKNERRYRNGMQKIT